MAAMIVNLIHANGGGCFIMDHLLTVCSFRVVGIYLQILIEIVKKDVSKFAIIFTIFWIMFSGSLFLILVGTNNTDGTMTGTDLDKIDGVEYVM